MRFGLRGTDQNVRKILPFHSIKIMPNFSQVHAFIILQANDGVTLERRLAGKTRCSRPVSRLNSVQAFENEFGSPFTLKE
jgi:hypothetical protein